MRRFVRWFVFLIAACGFLAHGACEVQARPSFGSSCRACHGGNVLPGLMDVTSIGDLLDLDAVNLATATDRGPLKVFDVVQGSTVTLTMDVLDGADEYAVQLKRLQTGGVLNSAGNALVFAPDGTWSERGATPYYTKDGGNNDGIPWSGMTTSYSFDLFVVASTPVDVYDLEFAVALAADGDATRYSDEHFYLRVSQVPEPSSMVLVASIGVGVAWYWRRRRRTQ